MKGCILDDLVGIRLSTHDGHMLQDHMSFGFQMTLTQMNAFYKVVWMKQHELIASDLALCYTFADRSLGVANMSMRMQQGN